MSEISVVNPISFSLFLAQRLVDRSFSPTIFLNFPLIRLRFPFSFVTVIAIDLVLPLIIKWSAIREDKYRIFASLTNQAYPDCKSIRQILMSPPSSGSTQPSRSNQVQQGQTQPSEQIPFLTTIFDPPRPPRLDTPVFPRYLSLVLMLSSPVASDKTSTTFQLALAEASQYPRFFVALIALILYFMLTAKEKQREEAHENKAVT
ncbi:MAG: hypothetical protein AWM53_01364 [Candidatus Dichloromethanomonas elyunquensis]|nr:MAG: hypothetical protein AWM53_01364 [Candidatus Dichloromethanomonas elyunquensis]